VNESTASAVARTTSPLTRFMPHWSLIVSCALLLWFSLPTLVSLNGVWSSYDYSHGYLVLGLTAFLVVSELRRVGPASPAPSWAGLVCLLLLAILTVAARVTTSQTVALLAWPLTLIAAIWAWTGWDNARRLVAPLSYLFVAIPVWGIFVEPLRRLTVLVVSMWIRIAGMPAFIEGNLIHVPSGTFEVLGGCAGLRYALVALALTVFVGMFNYRRWQPTAVLLLCGLLLVAVGNWVRVFITVAVGLSPEGLVPTLVRDHHTLFGWIVFVLFMIPLSLVHRKLESRVWAERSDAPTAGRNNTYVPSRGLVTYASCAVLGLATWFTFSMNGSEDESPLSVSLENPEIPGWTREAAWRDARLPVFAGAIAQDATWYTNGADRVGAYVVAVADQTQGAEITSLGNGPMGPSAVIVARRTVAVTAVSGATIPFLEIEVFESGDNRRLVWVGMRIAGSLTASDLTAKFLQLRGAIRGRHDAEALVLTVVCNGGCAEPRTVLSSFAATAAEPLYERAERAALSRRTRATATFPQ
jgi:EpsI family protein